MFNTCTLYTFQLPAMMLVTTAYGLVMTIGSMYGTVPVKSAWPHTS